MQISNNQSPQMYIKPPAPQAPVPPLGGNIENRQPPKEPANPDSNSAPTLQNSTQNNIIDQLSKTKDNRLGTILSIYA